MTDFIRLNGRVISAKSLSSNIAGVPYTGVTAADYEDKIETELVYALGQEPEDYVEGKYSVAPFTITLLKDVHAFKFLPQMAALSAANGAPGSVGSAPLFPITFQSTCRMSSPGTYGRCCANSTEIPWYGDRCIPVMSPSTIIRARKSSDATRASVLGSRYLR